MSAFMVSDRHIFALVNAASLRRVTWYHNGKSHDACDLDATARMLADENRRSLAARYGEKGGAEMAGDPIRPFRIVVDLPVVALLKAIRCFEYQACETEDWKDTEAHAFCDSLTAHLVGALPGYEDAPWGIPEFTAASPELVSLTSLARKVARS